MNKKAIKLNNKILLDNYKLTEKEKKYLSKARISAWEDLGLIKIRKVTED